jgi:hypothetical protein
MEISKQNTQRIEIQYRRALVMFAVAINLTRVMVLRCLSVNESGRFCSKVLFQPDPLFKSSST